MTTDRYEIGKPVRVEVLGQDYVTAKLRPDMDPHAKVWQEFATELVWGSIWARPGLSRQTRAILNIAMLVVIGTVPELKLYIRAALASGVTRDEITEVLLQAAVYGGAPKGNQAFHAMEETFNEIDAAASAATS